MERKDVVAGVFLGILYISLALYSLPDTGLTWDENRYISKAKARAYSIYAMTTGEPDLFFCDITKDFGYFPNWENGTEWSSRCWEGRPKLAITLSGVTWAGIWFFNGGLNVIESIMAHRIAIVLLTALGLIITYFFVRDAFNRRAAIFSVLAIIFMPRFFAHSMYVLMDGTVAIFWVATIFFFWKGLKNWKYGILSGVAMGLALASMAQAVFIIPIIILWLVVSYRDKFMGCTITEFKNFLKSVWMFIIIAPITCIATWPWLWYDTFNRIGIWMTYYISHISGGLPPTHFLGETVYYPPFYYNFFLAAAVIPIFLLIFACVGAVFAIKDTVSLKNRVSFLILLSAIVPILALALTNVGYNGVQHFVPAFLFIGILAGIGIDRFIERCEACKTFPLYKLWMLILLLMIIVVGFYAIINGHMDTYFNVIIGGIDGGATGLFEPVWSGEPYLEVAYWLSENVEPNSAIYVVMANNIFNTYKYGDVGQIAQRLDTSNLNFDFEQDTILREDIRIVSHEYFTENPHIRIDYIVVMMRTGALDMPYYYNYHVQYHMESSEPVYEVISYGATIVKVYKLYI